MAVYEYFCRDCGFFRESTTTDDVQRCSCGGISKRYYGSVQIGVSPFSPHYNYTVGRFVNSSHEYDEALKKASERNTLATGTEHNYVRVDPSDMGAFEPKTDTQAIEDSRKGWHDKLKSGK